VLQGQAQQLQHTLQQVMRRFGRQCRGLGKVFVTLVRQTEMQLLQLGPPVLPLAWAARACLHGTPELSAEQRARLDTQLTATLAAHHRIEQQSRRLTQGKALSHCKIVNAYDPTIAPICKGKSNCPAQFGRKPGIISDPAAGFIFALHLPVGNPSDVRYVEPLVDKVEQTIARVRTHPTPAIHSLAGDLALNDAALREALHARGILTVGIPKTVAPFPPSPTPEEVPRVLREAGLQEIRTPTQVQLAYACGYSRPVVESIIASLLCRGAGRLTYKGHRGAIVQTGMAVMAHNAATLVRIHEYRLSKRARMFRRRLRLRCRKVNHCNASIN
jgi:Transposase DDE domain